MDDLEEYRPPTPDRAMPHPIPEGIDGVLRMIAACKNEQQRALIALCGLAGLRLSEALSVTPSCFHTREQTLTVRGKGDKMRTVPLGDRAWQEIAPAFATAVLVGGPECPLVRYKDRFARQFVTSTAIRAGLKRHVSSHDLRATFATAVYDKTLDLRATQELLGHSSSKTTEGYTGRSMATMRAAADVA